MTMDKASEIFFLYNTVIWECGIQFGRLIERESFNILQSLLILGIQNTRWPSHQSQVNTPAEDWVEALWGHFGSDAENRGGGHRTSGRFITNHWRQICYMVIFLPITQKIKKQVVGMMIDVHINGEFHVMSSAVTCT